LAVAATAVIALLTREREPSYHGKPLAFWIAQFCPQNPPSHLEEEAEEAVRHIGTNAIPYLLRWMRYEEPSTRPFPKVVVDTIMSHLPRSLGDHIPNTVQRWLAGWDNRMAGGAPAGFAILGMAAAPAIPDLKELLKDRSRTNTCRWAIYSLAAISTNVPPVVMERLADPDPEQRAWAIVALATYSLRVADTRPAMPSLINCVQYTNVRVRSHAIWALGEIKAPTNLTIPALTTILTDQSHVIRSRATNALLRIVPEILNNAPPH
jgi:hypothetical protein